MIRITEDNILKWQAITIIVLSLLLAVAGLISFLIWRLVETHPSQSIAYLIGGQVGLILGGATRSLCDFLLKKIENSCSYPYVQRRNQPPGQG